MIIWLDDERDPYSSEWAEYIQKNFTLRIGAIVWLKTYEEFSRIKFCELEDSDVIFFDHDLGEGKSGYDAFLLLEESVRVNKTRLPNVLSQSMNPIGKKKIMQGYFNLLNWYGAWR